MENDLKNKFEEDGYVIIENLFGDDLLDKYIDLWNRHNQGRPEGWKEEGEGFAGKAFLDHSEILDILCSSNVARVFNHLEKPVALHADVTRSISTQFGWHQDNTMPVKRSGDNYVIVWIALEDVHPDSGPLEVIPGSHNWELDWEYLWQKISYTGIGEDLEKEIEKRKVTPVKFLAKKGDAIVWHGRLIHRGSNIVDHSKTRMALIGHYCNDYANMDQMEVQPEFPELIDIMINKDYRYAQWGSSGAMYFVDPDKTGYDDPDDA